MATVTFEQPDTFLGNVPLSYASVEALRTNAITLDAMSLRGRRAWTDQAERFLAEFDLNPSPLTRGAFQFRTGLTTLTLKVGALSLSGTHTAQVYFGGSSITTQTLTNNATTTISITLTGRGFTDKQIIDVEVYVARTSGAPHGYYELQDAYVNPASAITLPSGSWPGVPTFGSLSAANLNQLGQAQQWLFDRLNAVSMPLFCGQLFRPSVFWAGASRLLWQGSVAKSNGATRLSATLDYQNINVGAEYVQLYVNGTGYNTPSITAGQSGSYTFSIDLSGLAADTPIMAAMTLYVTADGPTKGSVGTRWSLRNVEMVIPSPSYATSPTVTAPLESMSFATLQSRLNAIATICSTVYSRISGAPDTFDRIRLFRDKPVLDEFQRGFYQQVYVPVGQRRTDALWVRGKDVKIGYGPMAVKHPNLGDLWTWETAYEESLISGDSVQDKYVSLDSLQGLFPGMGYYLRGADIRYAAEVWQ